MEELCRQLGVINDIDKKKTETIINILHIISIIIKLAIIWFIARGIINIIDNNMDKLLEFVMEHNSLSFIDSNELSSGLYLMVILVIMTPMILLTDILDLVINKERPFGQLILIASISYGFQLMYYVIYTNYDIGSLLVTSLLEPLVYLFLVCIVYIRFQYNNKIYHNMLAEEQRKYNSKMNNNINLTKKNNNKQSGVK